MNLIKLLFQKRKPQPPIPVASVRLPIDAVSQTLTRLPIKGETEKLWEFPEDKIDSRGTLVEAVTFIRETAKSRNVSEPERVSVSGPGVVFRVSLKRWGATEYVHFDVVRVVRLSEKDYGWYMADGSEEAR